MITSTVGLGGECLQSTADRQWRAGSLHGGLEDHETRGWEPGCRSRHDVPLGGGFRAGDDADYVAALPAAVAFRSASNRPFVGELRAERFELREQIP